MTEPALRERRRHPRRPVNVPITISADDGDISCRVKDISVVGVSATSNRPIAEMTQLAMQLDLDTADAGPTRIGATCVVVRCDAAPAGGYDIGLYFLEISDEDRLTLATFIDSALEAPAPED